MAYASASDVAPLVRQLLGSEANFTIASSPTLTDLNVWLSSGCAYIEMHLSSRGYTTPVPTSSAVYDIVRQLNALYGAYMAEFSRTNVMIGPGERTRSQQLEQQFWKGLDILTNHDLTAAGLSKATAPMYIGGTSYSDKDTYEDNTDIIPSRFKRGQFRTPGAVGPDRFESGSAIDTDY